MSIEWMVTLLATLGVIWVGCTLLNAATQAEGFAHFLCGCGGFLFLALLSQLVVAGVKDQGPIPQLLIPIGLAVTVYLVYTFRKSLGRFIRRLGGTP